MGGKTTAKKRERNERSKDEKIKFLAGQLEACKSENKNLCRKLDEAGADVTFRDTKIEELENRVAELEAEIDKAVTEIRATIDRTPPEGEVSVPSDSLTIPA